MIERRSSHWVALPAGILLAVGAYAWGRRSADPSESSPLSIAEDGKRLAALEREVQELRAANRRLRALESGDRWRKTETAAASVAAAAPSGHLEPSADGVTTENEDEDLDPATEERAQAEQLAFWNDLGRRVESETIDAAWSRATEPAITSEISARLGPEVRVDQVLCASSLCRASLSHPGWTRIPEEKLVEFALNRESLGAMEMQLDTREQGVTTFYFLRSELPAGEREP